MSSTPPDPETLQRALEELDALDALSPEPDEPLEAHLVEDDLVEIRTAGGHVKMAMPLSVYEDLQRVRPTIDLRTSEGPVEVPLPVELKGDDDAH